MAYPSVYNTAGGELQKFAGLLMDMYRYNNERKDKVAATEKANQTEAWKEDMARAQENRLLAEYNYRVNKDKEEQETANSAFEKYYEEAMKLYEDGTPSYGDFAKLALQHKVTTDPRVKEFTSMIKNNEGINLGTDKFMLSQKNSEFNQDAKTRSLDQTDTKIKNQAEQFDRKQDEIERHNKKTEQLQGWAINIRNIYYSGKTKEALEMSESLLQEVEDSIKENQDELSKLSGIGGIDIAKDSKVEIIQKNIEELEKIKRSIKFKKAPIKTGGNTGGKVGGTGGGTVTKTGPAKGL